MMLVHPFLGHECLYTVGTLMGARDPFMNLLPVHFQVVLSFEIGATRAVFYAAKKTAAWIPKFNPSFHLECLLENLSALLVSQTMNSVLRGKQAEGILNFNAVSD